MMKEKKIKCPDCNGIGRMTHGNNFSHKCNYCQGEGEINEEDHMLMLELIDMFKVEKKQKTKL